MSLLLFSLSFTNSSPRLKEAGGGGDGEEGDHASARGSRVGRDLVVLNEAYELFVV